MKIIFFLEITKSFVKIHTISSNWKKEIVSSIYIYISPISISFECVHTCWWVGRLVGGIFNNNQINYLLNKGNCIWKFYIPKIITSRIVIKYILNIYRKYWFVLVVTPYCCLGLQLINNMFWYMCILWGFPECNY